MTREELIEATVQSLYSPPPDMEPLKGRVAYQASPWIPLKRQAIASDAMSGLINSKDPMLRDRYKKGTNRDREAIARIAAGKAHGIINYEFNKRKGFLWNQAREAGIEKHVDPKEIMGQAAMMMPDQFVSGPRGTPSEFMAGHLKTAVREHGKGQRLRHQMEKRGLEYHPKFKGEVTRKMKRNRKEFFAGTPRNLPEGSLTREELIEAIVAEVFDDTYKPDMRSSTRKMLDTMKYNKKLTHDALNKYYAKQGGGAGSRLRKEFQKK